MKLQSTFRRVRPTDIVEDKCITLDRLLSLSAHLHDWLDPFAEGVSSLAERFEDMDRRLDGSNGRLKTITCTDKADLEVYLRSLDASRHLLGCLGNLE